MFEKRRWFSLKMGPGIYRFRNWNFTPIFSLNRLKDILKKSQKNTFAISVSGIEIFFRQIELNCLFDSAFNASKLWPGGGDYIGESELTSENWRLHWNWRLHRRTGDYKRRTGDYIGEHRVLVWWVTFCYFFITYITSRSALGEEIMK